MELTVHITYFPMEAQYGTSIWQGDTMLDMDYTLYDTKSEASSAGKKLKAAYIKSRNEELK